MILYPKLDNYQKFQFHLFLENFIIWFVSYGVIKFQTIENNRNSQYLKIIIEQKLAKSSLDRIFFVLKYPKIANNGLFVIN